MDLFKNGIEFLRLAAQTGASCSTQSSPWLTLFDRWGGGGGQIYPHPGDSTVLHTVYTVYALYTIQTALHCIECMPIYIVLRLECYWNLALWVSEQIVGLDWMDDGYP